MKSLVNEGGLFIDVEYFYTPSPMYIRFIKLIFQKGIFFITVQEDDSLELTENIAESILEEDGLEKINVSDELPWKLSIGKSVLWARTMVNQQGYFDGLQFDFANNVSQEPVIIQLISMPAHIDIFTVKRV